MGKEEAFFFSTVRNAMAEVISAGNGGVGCGQHPSYLHGQGTPLGFVFLSPS